MQNVEIEKAIPWNPWHGCIKVSPGCKIVLSIRWIKDMAGILQSLQKAKLLMN